jgi:hypothetical protein
MQLLAHMTFYEALFAITVFLAGTACGFGLALRRNAGRGSELDRRDTP